MAACIGLSTFECLLGGSWVVISGVISRVTILIIHIRGLITLWWKPESWNVSRGANWPQATGSNFDLGG